MKLTDSDISRIEAKSVNDYSLNTSNNLESENQQNLGFCKLCKTLVKCGWKLHSQSVKHRERMENICKKCGMGFRRAVELQNHESSISCKDDGQTCFICDKAFPRRT